MPKTTNYPEVTSIDDLMLYIVRDQASSPKSRKGALKEATFTPSIAGTGTAGAGTYTTQAGRYTKFIDIVFFKIALVWTAHTGSGSMIVTGLPFTARNDFSTPLSVYHSNVTLSAAGNKLLALVSPNTTQIALQEVGNGSAGLLALDAAGTLLLAGIYWI